jgi:hypothetical protein
MLYLIKRRPTASREELLIHWFKNHMPAVIRGQELAKEAGRPYARRYIATLFDAKGDGEYPWDGMAQLWWDKPLPTPQTPHGQTPGDTFQQKALPYMPWATTEYVVLDGSEYLPETPLTLNDPYPTSRSGFLRISFLVKAKAGTDFAAFYDHWLNVHVPNVRSVMNWCGGFRYVVSHSLEPDVAPYAGLAELYFHDAGGWDRYRELIRPDGMEEWVDGANMLVLPGTTDMIGIS